MTTLRAGLIGAHISRTRLPAALKIMCDHAGLALDFTLFDTATLKDFDFEDTLTLARADGWGGMSITHPFKTRARAFASTGMADNVAHLAACNTLVFDSPLRGYNTDYTGFLAAFTERGQKPGRVVMMGAGGVAQALAPALIELGASELVICDRDTARAAALAATSGGRAITPQDAPDLIVAADGLVNATPLGMAEYPGSAFEPALIGGQAWAFDAVYTPTHTAFLTAADRAGLHCITGFDLFRAMAVRSFEAYTGLTVPLADILPQLDALKPRQTGHKTT
ncbi:shikimate dehydrogenase family protein [Oceaniglobus ichthyenteri]|uniref:shikimate dehydrogenase family protein n=1 Tax=Oceaniglobus ichthyenteri TaxID=2136177 RepID=UPI000D3938AA|nr:NAD(P)-binding domain-containing protein [Oceaniglobus ichthyenteri]